MLTDFVVNISGLLWDSKTETSLTEVKFFEQVRVCLHLVMLFCILPTYMIEISVFKIQ